MTIVAAVLAGVVVGVILGALGGGGAIITIPVLAYGFGMTLGTSSTASLIIIGLSSVVAVIAHARAGRVDWGRGVAFAAVGMLGAAGGSVVSRGLDEDWLMLAFSVLLLVVAGLMLRRSTAPGREREPVGLRDPRALAVTLAAGLVVGLLTGFFGVGGGFAIVPALTLVLGLPMGVATATSLLVIALNSAAAFATRLTLGVDLDWPLVAAFTLATIVGSVIGARVVGRVDGELLKRGFAILLLVIAVWTLATTGLALAR